MKTCGQLRNVTTATSKKGDGEDHDRLAPAKRRLLRGATAPALVAAGLAMMAVAVPAHASGPATAVLTRAGASAPCQRQVRAGTQRVLPLRALPGRPGRIRHRSPHGGSAATFGRPSRMPWMYVVRAAPLAGSGHRSRMPWMYVVRAAPLRVAGHRECRSGAQKS
jgi:hypothetical protein